MRLDFTVKFFPLPTPLQCLSPVSTVCPWPLSKTVIVPVTCSNTVSEPHDCSGLVHWCGCMYTRQRKWQQERAYTLQVAAFQSHQCTSSGVSVSNHAKCASSAACMHTLLQRCFVSQPSIMQQASALGFIRSVPPSVCAVSFGSRTVQLERLGIPQLYFFTRKFLVLRQKAVSFPPKIPYVANFYCLCR